EDVQRLEVLEQKRDELRRLCCGKLKRGNVAEGRPSLRIGAAGQQDLDDLFVLRAAAEGFFELDRAMQRPVPMGGRAQHVRISAGGKELFDLLGAAVKRGVHQRLPIG